METRACKKVFLEDFAPVRHRLTELLGEIDGEQVGGYHMHGEAVGLDGIGNDVHECQAMALEDSEVCALPSESVTQLETISRLLSRLQQEGLIQVQGRVVKLLERPALKQLVVQSG